MKPLRILDVTLRDGGYRNNFDFSKECAVRIVQGLAATGVDFVEIGYCNGSFVRRPEHGLTSRVDDGYIAALLCAAGASARPGAAPKGGAATKLCVMVHPLNVTRQDLFALAAQGIDVIRVCLRPDQLDAGLATIADARAAGMAVSANVTRATELPRSTIIRMAVLAEEAGADLICIADSNGAMIPADVERLIGDLALSVAVPLGFHAHNNLSLALSNAIAASAAGAEYIDTAINGMGKGAGNLHLAMFIAYLDRIGRNHTYDLVKALELSSFAAREVPENAKPHPLIDVMTGAYNLSIDAVAKVAASQPARRARPEARPEVRFEALKELHEQRDSERRDGVGLVAPRPAVSASPARSESAAAPA
ncbi:hypothetical protein [Breoghania sp. JC706]|uniref:hypothetical protein n=1 Tax=Breoghania sp. JC706 TaxID=3117732 RepID=UPI00300A27C1